MYRWDSETLANVLTRSNSPVKIYESETLRVLTFSWVQTYLSLFLTVLVLDMLATSTFTGFALVFRHGDGSNHTTLIVLMSIALVSHTIGLYYRTSVLR